MTTERPGQCYSWQKPCAILGLCLMNTVDKNIQVELGEDWRGNPAPCSYLQDVQGRNSGLLWSY